MVVKTVFLVNGALVKVSWLILSLGAQIIYFITLFMLIFEEFDHIIDAISISSFKAF